MQKSLVLGSMCAAIVGLAEALATGAPPSDARRTLSDERTLIVDGRTRTYRVYRPSRLGRETAVPLILVLHAGFGTARNAESSYDWDALADEAGFVVVYPEGFLRAWNAGDFCCGLSVTQNVDDVGFLVALIEQVEKKEHIDRRRIFAAGLSNGAMMAYRLACEAPGRLASVGAVAGTMTVPCTNGKPTSILAIHGLADRHIPFVGGYPTTGVNKTSLHRAVPDVIRQWRQINTCKRSVTETSGAVTRDRASCASGREVTLITIADAGHQWPGGQPLGKAAVKLLHLDQPSPALNATRTLWMFFQSHSLPEP